jgi:hypothetical protein
MPYVQFANAASVPRQLHVIQLFWWFPSLSLLHMQDGNGECLVNIQALSHQWMDRGKQEVGLCIAVV